MIYFCPVNCSHNCSFLDFAAVVASLSEENSAMPSIAISFVSISLKRSSESKGSKSWTDEASTMLFCSETDTGDAWTSPFGDRDCLFARHVYGGTCRAVSSRKPFQGSRRGNPQYRHIVQIEQTCPHQHLPGNSLLSLPISACLLYLLVVVSGRL